MQYTLKAIRINRGESQEEAAKGIQISVETLANYEKGNTYPDIPTLKRIEKHYDVNYNDIDFFNNKLQLNSKTKNKTLK